MASDSRGGKQLSARHLHILDWDNIESDPARERGQFDEEDRAYVKANYPEDYAKYFAAFEGK